MTDSEQAKAALAALADGKSRQSHDAETGERNRRERGVADEPAEVTTAPGTPLDTTDGSRRQAEYRAVIERAVSAVEDLDAAVAFVDSVGLDRLEAAVETAEHEVSGLAADGREALAAFERFRVAADGPANE